MKIVRRKCGYTNGIDAEAMSSKRGLSLGWRQNCTVNLHSYSQYHIDVDIHDDQEGVVWHFTSFYGNLEEQFIWEKGRFTATNIRERLDRGVANLA
ncbi:hypothetical protein J1N35_021649 [Gossypium stocksii]|uniref:Uncharacterized protein n=1 Tax=Gossypium stocksii TaxID=47602 RepID=A0A9D3VF80_9ROSI|nr:hypothetical protein J1N35_021649 [Gossypium stocksii]